MNQEQDHINAQTRSEAIDVRESWVERLRVKWKLESIKQVFLVLLTFTATGSSVVFLKGLFFNAIGFDETTPMWLKTVTYLLSVMPAYQILLLFYGSLLGQFEFFWNKEKKLLRFLGKMLGIVKK